MGLYTLKFPFRKVLEPLAVSLKGVDPDAISYAAVAVALCTGISIYFSGRYPVLLLAAIVLTFLRMTLNTLDGVIAITIGKSSLQGEIVNALPDRYSDIFVMLGIAFSPYCNIYVGAVAAVSVLLVSYTGMLGKAIGVNWQHEGPLGKVERLILIMIACLTQYVLLRLKTGYLQAFSLKVTAIEVCMVWFIVGAQVSVYNRVRGALREIREKKHVP